MPNIHSLACHARTLYSTDLYLVIYHMSDNPHLRPAVMPLEDIVFAFQKPQLVMSAPHYKIHDSCMYYMLECFFGPGII